MRSKKQEVQFAISGHGMIAAVGNGDGKDGATYQVTGASFSRDGPWS
jgi:hypothetical protein